MAFCDEHIKLSVPETGWMSKQVCNMYHGYAITSFDSACVMTAAVRSKPPWSSAVETMQENNILCTEETPESVKSYDVGWQTFEPELIKSLSVDENRFCSEETPESVKSYDVGLQMLEPELSSFCISENNILCKKETPGSIKSYDVGWKTFEPEPIKSLSMASYLSFCVTFKEIVVHPQEETDSKPFFKSAIIEVYELYQQCRSTNFIRKEHKNWFSKEHKENFKVTYPQGRNTNFISKERKDWFTKKHEENCYFITNRNVIYILGLINQMISFCSGSSLVFLYLSLIIPFGVCDDFLLSYRHTGVYNPEENQYSFDTSGYVNDQVIDKYRSDISVDIPMVSWMEKNEEDAYWERQTALRRGWEKVFKDNLLILASRFNYTKRYHTLQLMYGCTLRDDNSSTGYYQYGFDGRDFLILDKGTLLWIPGTQKAEISAQRWNSDRDISEGVKVYLTEHCTSALKKYISYGREELEKRVAPEVKVWGIQKSDGITRLQCLVYGFHPRPVDVKWVRNGEDQLLSDEMSPILPHPDGTYQIRVSVEVITREGDTYSCHVDHSSLGEETLSVQWEPVSASISMIVGIVTAVVLVTVILVVALLIVRKQRKQRKLKEIF